MASKTTTAEALDRLAVQYQAVIDATAMLKEIGSLENARDEAIKARAAADDELASVKADVAREKAKVAKAKDQAEAMLIEANNAANQKIAAANAAAEQVLATANINVQQRISDAERAAANIKAGAQAELVALQAKLGELRQAIEQSEQELTAKVTQAADAEKRLEQARAKVRALVE